MVASRGMGMMVYWPVPPRREGRAALGTKFDHVETRMRWSGCLAGAVLAIALIVIGCDRAPTRTGSKAATADEAASADATTPGEAQPASAAQPHAAQTQPANAYLTINGKITEFPAARLRLHKTAEGVRCLLFSNDPRNATSSQYKGNSFYFELPLQITDPSDLGNAAYTYKSDDSEPAETPTGIFLHGIRYHLQPQDVAIRFDADGKKVMAQVMGRFLVVRNDGENVPGQAASVQGTLYTTAEIEEEK
jgi:hypothetical protein